jgi:hypothetical protein
MHAMRPSARRYMAREELIERARHLQEERRQVAYKVCVALIPMLHRYVGACKHNAQTHPCTMASGIARCRFDAREQVGPVLGSSQLDHSCVPLWSTL